MERWAKDRNDRRMNVLSDLYEWDRELMALAESHTEYQDLRTWRLSEAVRWLVQRAIQPS